VLLPSATSSNLSFSNIQGSNAGPYALVVSNAFGMDTSRVTQVTVNIKPFYPQPPQHRIVTVGDRLDLSVVVDGTPPFGFRWRRGSFTVVPLGEGTTTFSIANVLPNDAGIYTVVATNIATTSGSISSAGYVTVIQPPANRSVLVGSNVTLQALVWPAGTNLYQWQSNGVNILNATNTNLVLSEVTPAYAGNYTFIISNTTGISRSFTNTLTVQTTGATAPVITEQPTNMTVTLGKNGYFKVVANGTDPLSYQWYFSATNIPNATNTFHGIPNVQATNLGSYFVVISNAVGQVTSAVAILSAPLPPAIATQPTNLVAIEGGPANFTVVATGAEPLAYQWWFNQTTLLAGQTNASLTIPNAQSTNAGNYYVVITNSLGSITSALAVLTLLTPPSIVSQPTNMAVQAGDTANLTVVATGTPPLAYQWWFNQTNQLAGETNPILVVANVQAANVGSYHVVVTNVAGSITSAVATLTLTTLDRDGDGIPDDWEIAHGLDPNLATDANLDTDNDGLTNLQEYLAGTNPTNAASVLKFESSALSGTTNLLLQFNAVSNKSYSIEYRNNVTGQLWQEWLAIDAVSSNRVLKLTNALGTNAQRYFRIGTPKQ
jgi:hypothetical protein